MSLSELREYGIEEMGESEIEEFLSARNTGVLGLADGAVPYLIPLSYALDRDLSLYFTYLLGEESRKETLTERADRGRFLVYQAESLFEWRSVLATGRFEEIRPSEWGALAELLGNAWRPEVFRTASTSRNIKVYEFDILELSGIKHTGLAPGDADE